jgi:chromosome segregation ATPase
MSDDSTVYELIDRLSKSIGQLARSCRRLEVENFGLKNDILELEARIDELEADTRQLAEFIKGRNDKVSKLKGVILKLEDEIRKLEDEIRDLADAEIMMQLYRSENLQLKAANKTPKMVEEVPLKVVEEVIVTNSEHLCVICLHRPSKVAVIPCGHRCFCVEDSQIVDKCPICRIKLTGTLQIFDV